MVVAEIYISQGIDDHRFIIDGETVSENSPMTGFRHKPFEPGRFRTASRPSRTWICSAPYSCVTFVSSDIDSPPDLLFCRIELSFF